jgi:hypothetical protein
MFRIQIIEGFLSLFVADYYLWRQHDLIWGPLYMDHGSCVLVAEESVVQEPVADAPAV